MRHIGVVRGSTKGWTIGLMIAGPQISSTVKMHVEEK